MHRLAIVVAAALVGVGCGHHEASHLDVLSADEGAGVEVPLDPRWAPDVPREPSRVAADSGRPFSVALRTPELVQYPCARCHEEGQAPTEQPLPERAHWQIERPHGVAAELTCQTCHPADRPGSLRDVFGREVDFDHGYQLCGACHFEQLREWANGAHGKRLAGWSGERVVRNCAGCHDPHDPSFETRLPAIAYPAPEVGRSR